MNTYGSSDGTRYTRPQIEARMRKTKQLILDQQRITHGFNFCEDCKRSSGVRIDCAHRISVKECLESGKAELAWAPRNIRPLCRDCHHYHDKLNIQSQKTIARI